MLRLPRTRGDGPAACQTLMSSRRASPHTRGWTHDDVMCAAVLQGFPAHAGMDPVMSVGEIARYGLPRTRGDGPPAAVGVRQRQTRASPHTRGWTLERCAGDRSCWRLGFPAHAGMDPGAISRADCVFDSASPHTRGWTPMPPHRIRMPDEGLPRTRGDGPVPPFRRCSDRFSRLPRTRGGWTRRIRGLQAPRRGFLAHAGMDPAASSR